MKPVAVLGREAALQAPSSQLVLTLWVGYATALLAEKLKCRNGECEEYRKR